MPDVEVYLSPSCVYCWKARFKPWRNGIRCQKVTIRFHFGFKLPTMDFKEMIRRMGGDSTIPQIFVDGKYLGTDEALTDLGSLGDLKSQPTQLQRPTA